MAMHTNPSLANQLIYSIYVRNYGAEGTFGEVERDLERIKSLGTDIIWFLPIHPIGKKNKKGTLGCPYSIQDYRGVNPEYGSMEDFKRLCEAIHQAGMKCIIDVVYNHTSWDSVLVETHPQWFYRDKTGTMGNRAGAWDDIVDLDYDHRALWEYQIESLCQWVKLGVDGFRCDVASTVPVEFWCQARATVEEIKPETIWLAESVHRDFIKDLREKGFYAASDSELYQAFDMTYDYDIFPWYEGVFNGENSTADYLREVIQQGSTYPCNYLKMRCLENHDQKRAAAVISDRKRLEVWTAYIYFLKGVALLYNGQEAMDVRTPSLFDIEKITWEPGDDSYLEYLKKLAGIRKNLLMRDGIFAMSALGSRKNIASISYTQGEKTLIGYFDLDCTSETIAVSLDDGTYRNLLGGTVAVKNGMLSWENGAIIIKI